MTVFAIAWKDIKKIYRSAFTLVMMFAAPFLITGLLYFAFGNSSEESGGMEAVRLGFVNNDSGAPYLDAGEQMAEYLQSRELRDIILFEAVENEARGKEKIRDGELDAVIKLPSDFSSSFSGGSPSVELFTDPAGTVQPELVSSLISDYIAVLSGLSTYFQALPRFTGEVSVSPEKAEDFAERYIHSGEENRSKGSEEARLMSMLTMCAMTVFFVFFAASVTAQSLVTEREEGTFQRMSVTPNRFAVLLTGKFMGVLGTISIQSIILLTGATFLFGIEWSSLPALILVTAATIVGAAGFTIFLMSLVDNSRQVGAISAGALTLGGMLGGLFTVGIPNMPGFFGVVNKVVPQGWAIAGYRGLLLPEGAMFPVWISALVTAGFGILFLTAGTAIISRKLR